MALATIPGMARSIFQTVDFTCIAMQKVHSTCDMISQPTQKGTVTRLWDFAPGFVIALAVALTIALMLGASLVMLALHDRKVEALRNKVIPMPRKVRCIEPKTVNMKGNR